MIGGPLEEVAQIMAVGVEGPAALAGQERDGRQLGLIRCPGILAWLDGDDRNGDCGHG